MQKTGESYTSALAKLTAKRGGGADAAADAKSAGYARVAGKSDAAVRASTGKSWTEWVRILDVAGGRLMKHPDIAKLVASKYDVPSWWAQTVTVGYERIRGLRDHGQVRTDGTYRISKSKTMAVPAARLFRAIFDARARKGWLGDVTPTVRKAVPNRSVRFAWPDGTKVEAVLIAKGTKTQLAVQHEKLASKLDAERARAFWGERLDALAARFGK